MKGIFDFFKSFKQCYVAKLEQKITWTLSNGVIVKETMTYLLSENKRNTRKYKVFSYGHCKAQQAHQKYAGASLEFWRGCDIPLDKINFEALFPNTHITYFFKNNPLQADTIKEQEKKDIQFNL